MAEQSLIEYIKKAQATGAVWDTIKQDLISAGWAPHQIEEAYNVLNVPRPAIPIPASVAPSKRFAYKKQNFTSPYSGLLALVLLVSLLILAHNAVGDLLDKFTPLPPNNYDSGFYQSQEYRDYQVNKELPPQQSYVLNNTNNGFKNFINNSQDLNRNYEINYQEWQSRDKALYDKYFLKYQQKQPKNVSPSYRLIFHAGLVLPLWIITFLLSNFLKEERKKYGALLIPYHLTFGWLLIYLFFNVAKYIYNANTVWGVYVVLALLATILTGAVWGIQKYRHNQQI